MPINVADTSTFLSWAKEIFSYIHFLLCEVTHHNFDNYSAANDLTRVLQKKQLTRELKQKFQTWISCFPSQINAKIFSPMKRINSKCVTFLQILLVQVICRAQKQSNLFYKSSWWRKIGGKLVVLKAKRSISQVWFLSLSRLMKTCFSNYFYTGKRQNCCTSDNEENNWEAAVSVLVSIFVCLKCI